MTSFVFYALILALLCCASFALFKSSDDESVERRSFCNTLSWLRAFSMSIHLTTTLEHLHNRIIAPSPFIVANIWPARFFCSRSSSHEALLVQYLSQVSSATSQALICRAARHLFVSGYRATAEVVSRLSIDVVWQRRALLAMAQHALACGEEARAVALLETALNLQSTSRPTLVEAAMSETGACVDLAHRENIVWR